MQGPMLWEMKCAVLISKKTLSNRFTVELSLMSLESEAGNLLSY